MLQGTPIGVAAKHPSPVVHQLPSPGLLLAKAREQKGSSSFLCCSPLSFNPAGKERDARLEAQAQGGPSPLRRVSR